MKCGLRSQAAGVKSRPSGAMKGIIKNVPWLRSMNRQGEKSFDGRAPLAFPLWPSCPATTGWAEGGHLSQWGENKRGTSQSEVPLLFRLAPRAGLEPATSRLQVPRFFNRAWTISSPACITCRGGCRALLRRYWTGSAASSLCTVLPTR